MKFTEGNWLMLPGTRVLSSSSAHDELTGRPALLDLLVEVRGIGDAVVLAPVSGKTEFEATLTDEFGLAKADWRNQRAGQQGRLRKDHYEKTKLHYPSVSHHRRRGPNQ